jgi:hypothetical protein
MKSKPQGVRLDTPTLVLPPDVGAPKSIPHAERPPGDWGRFILRFIKKIQVVPNDPDGCWLWTGAKDKEGAGSTWIGGALTEPTGSPIVSSLAPSPARWMSCTPAR